MQVNTTELEYCKLKAEYVADPEVVKEKYDEVLEKIKSWAAPGFRKGKATPEALKLRYKDYILHSVKDLMLNQAHDDVLFETKIKPMGAPQVLSSNLKDKSFECQLVYMNKPEFELANYKYEVPKPHVDFSVEDNTQRVVQQLREQHGTVQPYEESDFVQAGDTVTLAYETSTTIDGDVVIGEVKEGELHKIGSAAWDVNLHGAKAGEIREFDVEVDGKPVHYKVNVFMGMKSKPAALDDELAKKFGFPDINTFVSHVESTLQNQHKNAVDAKIAEQIKLRLVADNQFEVPSFFKLHEAQIIALQEGKKWEDLDANDQDAYLARGAEAVRLSLVLDRIRENEPEAELSEAEAVGSVKQMLLEQGKNPDAVLGELQKTGRLYGVIASVQSDFVMKWLVNNATIVE